MADQRRPPLPETRRRQHARLDTSRESNPDLYEEHLKTYKLEDDPRTYGPSTQLYMRFVRSAPGSAGQWPPQHWLRRAHRAMALPQLVGWYDLIILAQTFSVATPRTLFRVAARGVT